MACRLFGALVPGVIIGSDNGLSPARHQAIIWTNAGVLLIGPLGINFCEIWKQNGFHSRKCVWKCRLQNGGHIVSTSLAHSVYDTTEKCVPTLSLVAQTEAVVITTSGTVTVSDDENFAIMTTLWFQYDLHDTIYSETCL